MEDRRLYFFSHTRILCHQSIYLPEGELEKTAYVGSGLYPIDKQ
jgi:hypothetical protein